MRMKQVDFLLSASILLKRNYLCGFLSNYCLLKVDLVDGSAGRRLQWEEHEGETTGSSRAHGKRPTGAKLTAYRGFTLNDRTSLFLVFLIMVV